LPIRLTWRYHFNRPVSRALIIFGLLVSASWTWRLTHADRTPADHDHYHNRTFHVVRVRDGDTFDVDAPDSGAPTTRVRHWGVDTPEVADSQGTAMHFGKEASAFTTATIAGRDIRLVLAPEQTRDAFDRLLAYAYVGSDPVSLNERLIETGHAYADTRFPHPWRARFEALERHAQKAGKGLWKELVPDQMPDWRRNQGGR